MTGSSPSAPVRASWSPKRCGASAAPVRHPCAEPEVRRARVARGNKTARYAAGGVTGSASFRYPTDVFNFQINDTINVPGGGMTAGYGIPPGGGGGGGRGGGGASQLRLLFDYWLKHYETFRKDHPNIYGDLSGPALFKYWETHWKTWIKDNMYRVGGGAGGGGGTGPGGLPPIGGNIIKALHGTASQIAGAMKSLTAEVLKAYNMHTISGREGSYLTNLIQKDNVTLQMLAKDRKKIEDEIQAADSYAKQVTQATLQWATLRTRRP